jgi:O-methyltransferase
MISWTKTILFKVAARLRKIELKDYNKGCSHAQILPVASYSPWLDNEEFKTIFENIKYHTLVDIYRCYELYMLAKQVHNIEGNILEVGVWKGGTAKLLRQFVTGNQNIYLADTFTGVVKASKEDSLYKGGEHSDTSESIVRNLFAKDVESNTIFLKGIFPEDTGSVVKDVQFKFVHIDVDTHDSAKDTFHFVWQQVVQGGIVVFDDYGFNGCEGVTNFFNELTIENAIKLYNINGHGVIIKTKM